MKPIYNSVDEDAVVKISHSDTCELFLRFPDNPLKFSHRCFCLLPRYSAQERNERASFRVDNNVQSTESCKLFCLVCFNKDLFYFSIGHLGNFVAIC